MCACNPTIKSPWCGVPPCVAPPQDPSYAIRAIHNRSAGELVRQIVRPTIDAGGTMTDVLVLLESVVTGVLELSVKLGGDNAVLDVFAEGVRRRMAELRLADLPTAGAS